MSVIVCGRNLTTVEAVATQIRSQGGNCRATVVDLSSIETATRGAINCIKSTSGEKIRLVVNNAGTMGNCRKSTLTTNLVAQMVFTLTLLPALAPNCLVTNVASSSHLRARYVHSNFLNDDTPDRFLNAYAESKLGLMHCSRLLTAAGISCVDCHPGLVWTSMLQSRFPSAAVSFLEKVPTIRRKIFRDPEQAADTIVTACLETRPPVTRQLYVVNSKFILKGPQLAPESNQPAAIVNTWQNLVRPAIDTFLNNNAQDLAALRLLASGRDRIDLACDLAFVSSPAATSKKRNIDTSPPTVKDIEEGRPFAITKAASATTPDIQPPPALIKEPIQV